MLRGAILAPGQRTIRSILRGLGVAGGVHFQNYDRGLNRAQGSSLGTAKRLFQERIRALAPSARSDPSRGRWPQNLTDRAKPAILPIRRWAPQRVRILVAASRDAVLDLLAGCQRLHGTWMVPLRLDAARFGPAPRPRRGQKGRPRLKGQRLPPLAARLKNPKTSGPRLGVPWDGPGQRRVEVASGIAVGDHSGKIPVLIR